MSGGPTYASCQHQLPLKRSLNGSTVVYLGYESWGLDTCTRRATTPPRAEELVRMALVLEPENEEAKGLLREFLGDENCRRKEMGLQV